MSDEKKRSFETTLEVDAPPEDVWRALTDAEDLTRWFPLAARVTPGVGGSVWISWGDSFEGEMRIEIWEPNVRLRCVDERASPFDAEGGKLEASPPVRIAIDYHLESRGGKTVLRLVHSGFGQGAEWDDEFQSISKGWKFELRGLRHYLERHKGRPRRVAWARLTTSLSVPEGWARVTGRDGLAAEGTIEGLAEGSAYSIRAATGDAFSGVVHQCNPPWDFSGTVRGLNDALLRVAAERFTGRTSVNVWLSTYDVDDAFVEGFQARMTDMLQRVCEP